MKETIKLGISINTKLEELEKVTEKDYSDINFKHNKKNEKNNS